MLTSTCDAPDHPVLCLARARPTHRFRDTRTRAAEPERSQVDVPEKLPLGVGLIEPTSPTRSARHEVGTCVSDTRQTNRRRRVISTTSDCSPQQWRTRACKILPPPGSLAPFDLRNLRPLRLLKTTAIPLRSPRTSDPAPRRDLALTGVSAPKDAPRSTSTSALHRARPMRGRDA